MFLKGLLLLFLSALSVRHLSHNSVGYAHFNSNAQNQLLSGTSLFGAPLPYRPCFVVREGVKGGRGSNFLPVGPSRGANTHVQCM